MIVVDDQSTDATPRILAEAAARDPRLRVLRGAPLPPGWKGKPHAMAQGAAAARGDWLLFTDADTMHHPAALVSAVADAYAQGADLYTIQPDLIMEQHGRAAGHAHCGDGHRRLLQPERGQRPAQPHRHRQRPVSPGPPGGL